MNTNTESEVARVKSKVNARPRRLSIQPEILEDKADAAAAKRRLATNDSSQNRSLDDLRKKLGR